MSQPEIGYSTAGHIATICLNAPERGNALRPAMIEALFAASDEVLRDDQVRVVVLRGAGAVFCDDDPQLAAVSTNGVDTALQVYDLFAALHRDFTDALLLLDKPTIASINGRATGRGCDLALTCDMRVAVADAQIATRHLKHGLVPGITTYLLPRIVGLGKACELLFTGDAIDGVEAGRIGLVDDVVAADQFEEATYALASRIAKGPPVAMRFTKRALYRGLSSSMDAAKEYTTMARTLGMRITDETREGFQSFVEKREPHF